MLPVDDNISFGNFILVFGLSFLFSISIILKIICIMMMLVTMQVCDVGILLVIILGLRDRLFCAGLGNL